MLPHLLLCLALQSSPSDASYESYLAHVSAAQAHLRLGDLDEYRRWLDRAPKAHRGFEWRWLDSLRDQSLTTWTSDSKWTALAFSPDGTRIALGDEKGSIVLRESRDGKEIWRIAAHGDEISWIDFDAKGERLLTSGHDRKAKVFDARTGKMRLEFTKHGYPLGGAVFSPDESLVASCSYERPPNAVVGTVHLWNPETGEVAKTFEGGRKPLSSIAFSPDGKLLAAGSWDFCVFVWDIEKGGEPRKFAMPDEGKYNAVDAIAFSSDGSKIVAGSKDDTARAWDIATGNLLVTLRGHDNYIYTASFSPDGSRILTGGGDQTLRIWDAETGKSLATLRGALAPVRAASFSPDGNLVWSVSSDGSVRKWSADTNLYETTRLKTSAAAYASVFSPDGSRLATCSYDGRVQVWDARSWDLLASRAAHPGQSSCHLLAYSPDGRRLYSGSYDKTIAAWDAITLEELGRMHLEGGAYVGRLSPDGKTFAVGQTNRKIALWDGVSLRQRALSDAHAASVNDLAFSPDGKRLAVAVGNGVVGIWDVAAGREIAKIETGGANSVLFSRDGAALFVGASGRTLKEYRTSDWSEIRSMPSGRNAATRLALASDGKRLAIGSRDAVLFDLQRGEIALALRPHDSNIWFLEWSPQGEILATAAMSDGVGILDPRPISLRLAERESARIARAAAKRWVAERLKAGATLASLAKEILADPKRDRVNREAHLAAVTIAGGED